MERTRSLLVFQKIRILDRHRLFEDQPRTAGLSSLSTLGCVVRVARVPSTWLETGQIHADDAILGELYGLPPEQVGDHQTQRRKQEGPCSLREFRCLLVALVHADRDVKELKALGPLTQRCDEPRLLRCDHRRGLMTNQCRPAALADQALDGAGEGVETTRKKDDVVRDETSIHRAREVQMVLQSGGNGIRMLRTNSNA